MAKNTRPLSGAAQKKYFRDLLRSDAGVAPDAVDRLSEICAKEIASIRVRLPLAVRKPAKASVAAAVAKFAPAAAETAPAGAAFDPHAFSLIVLYRKGGRDGLIAKLQDVTDVEQLRAIAKAQHVSLDESLSDRAAMLDALVEGTERRIAHRQAAAS